MVVDAAVPPGTTSTAGRALLIGTYDLGHQPFGLASPAAWLRNAGFGVDCLDLSRCVLDADLVARAAVIGFHIPMHTATRLAVDALARVRAINPSARICCFGLYGQANADHLLGLGVDVVITGEFEAELVGRVGELRRRPGLLAPGGHPAGPPGLPGARPRRPAGVGRIRAVGDRGRAPGGRVHRDDAGLSAHVSALPGRAGLRRADPGGATGGRAGRHRGPRRRRRPPHHLRRPGLPQRPRARPPRDHRGARPLAGTHLRRHDQGRAPAGPPGPVAAARAKPGACS